MNARRRRAPSLAERAARIAVAGSALVAFTSVAVDAGAHGSRLVPLEDQPVTRAPAPPPSPPRQAPAIAPRAFDWTGLRLGGHLAFDLGQGAVALPAAATAGSLRSVFGGAQIGYDHELPSRLVLGVEGDVSFPYFADDGVVSTLATPRSTVGEKLDFVSTLRGRVGYAFDRWLVYGTGGLAWSQARFTESPGAGGASSTVLRVPVGWSAGAGAELAIAPAWSLRLEYLFDRLGGAGANFPSGATDQAAPIELHTVRLGLDWHFDLFGERSAAGPDGDAWLLAPEDWNAHGQFTFIEQGYFRFRSPYQGPNSLSGATQFQNTVSTTAFLGLRLWRGAELYLDPEVDQGYGLSQTLGVAAFPNGEAQKASYPVPRLNIDRAMIRETFGLGGEQARLDDGPNQLPGTRDVSRITVTVGRFSVGDLFGLNTYAADPRTQFFNWNVYGSGSYDWTMDKPGFTWGAVVELNQKRWALRAGYLLEPTQSNGNTFDTDVPTRGQYLVEPELRYSLFDRPGKLRLMGWATRANMGSYADALAMPLSTPGYPDLTQTRRVRVTYGVVANVEQALSRDVGLFSRASWTPGLVEVMGWTDCDESVSLGASLAGTAWRRPGDTLGVAGVVEGLSAEARAYFEAGGLGIVIGDGRLTYRPEQVLEAFYAYAVAPWATLTADLQLVANPGYNADRGPVPIYGARLHAEL